MHDSRKHHRHLGSRTREIVFVRDTDYGGVLRVAGDVLIVPVHIADALLRCGCAVLHVAWMAEVEIHPIDPPAVKRRGRRHRSDDGDGG